MKSQYQVMHQASCQGASL